MKQTKREFLPLYSYYDREGIAHHLEEKASDGWLLEKLGLFCWRYRRIEPKPLHFSVTFFRNATPFTPVPNTEQQLFWDFCAEAGWRLAAETAQVQIFYNENEDAVPIETDPAVELNNIHKVTGKNLLGGFASILLISLIQLGMFVYDAWNKPVELFSDTGRMVSALTWLPILAVITAEILRYYRWHRKAKLAVEAGLPLPNLRSTRKSAAFVYVLVVAELIVLYTSYFAESRGSGLLMLAILLYMALMFLLTFSARDAMKHLGFKPWVNIAVTYGMVIVLTVAMMGGLLGGILHFGSGWLNDSDAVETYEYRGMTWSVYRDPLPLTIQDLTETDYSDWSTQLSKASSPLLTHIEATQRPRMDALSEPDLEYELVKIKAGILYNACKNQFIRWLERWNNETPPEHWDEYRPMDSALWGASEVYQRYSAGEPINQFLICWPDRIAEICFDWEWNITDELIRTTAEKLKAA